MELGSFDNLTPDNMIDAVEQPLERPMSGLAAPLPSYINRVYELQTMAGERLIAKFYRPGRWSYAALLEEHQFVMDCAADEIPVIAPMLLPDGKTIGVTDENNFFVLYPKRFGREIEINQDEDWIRLGRVVARMHLAGSRAEAPSRIHLHPATSTANDIQSLLNGNFIPNECQADFITVTTDIIEELTGLFDDIEYIRIHGDCHRANILERPGEGFMIIDFDDMMTGPPIQDLWLLLPGYAMDCQREINLIIEGYCEMRDFDDWTIRLIEPLRIMRLIYFLAWCARQSNDLKFRHHFPDWGSNAFWRREIVDLHDQLGRIRAWQDTHSGNSISVTNGIYSERIMTDF
jgi:Ser/Thr protein kinase RdoA (MazF antagonist)